GLVQHRSAPDDGFVFGDEVVHRHHLDAVGAGRNDGLVDHDRRPLYPEHPWDREPPDVPVDDPHAMAPASQGDGEVGADRGLADPALSGRDGDYPGAVAGLAYLRARL